MRIYPQILLLLALCRLSNAQIIENPEVTLTNPYNTILTHLHYLQTDTYHPDRAAQTFNIQDSLEARQLAIKLKQIYDGLGLYVNLSKIPQDPNYIDSSSMASTFTPFPKELPQVYLEKSNDKWYYADQTVQSIPHLHKRVFPFGSDILVNLIPYKNQQRFLGLALWQYVGLILLLAILFLLQFLFAKILRPFIRYITKTKFSLLKIPQKTITTISKLLSSLIIIWCVRFFFPILQMPIKISEFVMTGMRILATVVIVLIAFECVKIIQHRAMDLSQQTANRMDEHLVPILFRIIKILIVIFGLIHIFGLLDINLTALIAGLSIGGLALALAAQDTVKNLIGSALILFDKPFQIGDYIIASGFEGTVVEVGFRSTRIMTSDTSIISVPNGSLAGSSITNKGVRALRLMHETLSIEYDTSAQQIRNFINGLKHVVQNNNHTKKQDYYIHLNRLGESSLDILFRCYLDVPGWADELRAREEILMQILDLAEKLGVQFAYPTRKIIQSK